ncbi:hypothetical protein SLEP1_g44452 [Rubroshorea leprosula]|uniref:Uncharacterized protein n=1 Tax=Rubroshorea leprosula TaxID=152421 RepID=A0AAV5LG79_9ROSI|nr:hypothetical protein SLEP1_g44452 [Rubroshorea leprosula]
MLVVAVVVWWLGEVVAQEVFERTLVPANDCTVFKDNDQQVYFVEIPGDESALAAKGLEHVIPRRLPSKIPLDKVFNGLRLKRGSSNSPTSPTAKKLKPSPLLRLNPLLPLPSPGNVKFP